MKKVYEKPQVYMERFELAEHIAGCSLTINNTEFDCSGTGTINGETIPVLFVNGNELCKTVIEGYCYTNSAINVSTINS